MPALAFENTTRLAQTQSHVLSQAQLLGLGVLQKPLAELRAELQAELARNPVIEPVEGSAGIQTVSQAQDEAEERVRRDASDYPDDNDDRSLYVTDAYSGDADAAERRQAFFDRVTAEETLQEHLLRQVASDPSFTALERSVLELMIGDLDERGYFRGSLPDLVMVSGLSERELRELLARLRRMDPPGCGATNLAECLLAQLDAVPECYRDEIRELVTAHLDDLAAGRLSEIRGALGVSDDRLEDLRSELKALEPFPGRKYASAGNRAQFIEPDIQAVEVDGRWLAIVDETDVPEFRYSPHYMTMLEDPSVSAEAKRYVREKIAAAREIWQAVRNRHLTIQTVAQEIFDAQPGFFEKGLSGLAPLTQQDIAARVGLDPSTVSRAVNGKFVKTPRGIFEMKRFFMQGVATASGEVIARQTVQDRLRSLVAGENPAAPLSDEKLAELLKAEGFDVARRTVAKYRGMLSIPSARDRRGTGQSEIERNP